MCQEFARSVARPKQCLLLLVVYIHDFILQADRDTFLVFSFAEF